MKKNYFKTTFLLLITCVGASTIDAQDFTWINGSNIADMQGFYGTQGSAAPTNSPGARQGAVSWTDLNGDFWLFGGTGYDEASGLPDYLNDLWKYNKLTNEWTWMKGSNTIGQYGVYGTMGISAAANTPGGRAYCGSWADASGNLWLFGGRGYASGGASANLNDLWKYDITTNQWTWMKGSSSASQFGVYGTQGLGAPANTPGARQGTISWRDNADNLWLFGGAGLGSASNGDLNDLWRYNITNDVWTWVKGTGNVNQFGAYGTMGVASPTNNPGGRSLACGWKTNNGNLWLFGGLGLAASGSQDALGDLWVYDVISNHWTWVKGYNTMTVQQSVYGTQGVAAPSNLPGSRYGSLTWRDGNGDLWLFGGLGFDGGLVSDNLNDFWRYNTTTNEWKWVKGSSVINQSGFYGTQGISSPFNMPGARLYASGWMDSSNNLWLFGGQGKDGQNNAGRLNDLWKFSNCIGPTLTITSTGVSYMCAGQTATLTASGAYSYTWNVNQTISSTLAVSPQGSSSYTVFGTDVNGCKDTLEYIQTVVNPPTVVAQNLIPEVCPGQAGPLSAGGALTYTWSTQEIGATISVTPAVTTVYTVTGTDQNGCIGEATVTQSVGCVGFKTNAATEHFVSLYPNPNTGEFQIRTDLNANEVRFVLQNTLGQKIYEEILPETSTHLKLDLPTGIYYYTFLIMGQKNESGKMIIH